MIMRHNPLRDLAIHPLGVVNVDMVYELRYHVPRQFRGIGIAPDDLQKHIGGIKLAGFFFELGAQRSESRFPISALLSKSDLYGLTIKLPLDNLSRGSLGHKIHSSLFMTSPKMYS